MLEMVFLVAFAYDAYDFFLRYTLINPQFTTLITKLCYGQPYTLVPELYTCYENNKVK